MNFGSTRETNPTALDLTRLGTEAHKYGGKGGGEPTQPWLEDTWRHVEGKGMG